MLYSLALILLVFSSCLQIVKQSPRTVGEDCFNNTARQIIYLAPSANLPENRITTSYDYYNQGLWIINTDRFIPLKTQLDSLTRYAYSHSFEQRTRLKDEINLCKKRVTWSAEQFVVSPDHKLLVTFQGSSGLGKDFYLTDISSDTLVRITNKKYGLLSDIDDPMSYSRILPYGSNISFFDSSQRFIYLDYMVKEKQSRLMIVDISEILSDYFSGDFDSIQLPISPSTILTSNVDLRHPIPSPDGSLIAIVKYVGKERNSKTLNESGLYIFNIDGTKERKVASGLIKNPRWHPNGRFIYYINEVESFSPHEIMRVDIISNEIDSITKGGRVEEFDLSPDGSKLGYIKSFRIRGKSGLINYLYYSNSDGTVAHEYKLKYIRLIRSLRWSPDSKMIGFITMEPMTLPRGTISKEYSVSILDVNADKVIELTEKSRSEITALRWR